MQYTDFEKNQPFFYLKILKKIDQKYFQNIFDQIFSKSSNKKRLVFFKIGIFRYPTSDWDSYTPKSPFFRAFGAFFPCKYHLYPKKISPAALFGEGYIIWIPPYKSIYTPPKIPYIPLPYIPLQKPIYTPIIYTPICMILYTPSQIPYIPLQIYPLRF